jgi:hypothetical protein
MRKNNLQRAEAAAAQTVFTHMPEEQILVVKTSGVIPSSSWPAIIRQVTDEGTARSCIRYLIDHLDARFRIRFADLWSIPRNAGRFELPPGARIALLLPPHHTVQKQFIEAFNSNRGFSLRVFDDRARAVAWLMEAAPRPNLLFFP